MEKIGIFNDFKRINDSVGRQKRFAFRYEGDYLNELKHGTGREEFLGTNLAYDGTWSNGLFHGSGKLYGDNDTLEYEGDWSNCLVHGYGVIYKDGKAVMKGILVIIILMVRGKVIIIRVY